MTNESEYTYEVAMEQVEAGMSIHDAFSPFLVAADAAPGPQVSTVTAGPGFGIRHNRHDIESRILARDEAMLYRNYGGAA